MTPARKLTHNMKFEHFWMQKDTSFENAIIIHHFGPEKRQKSDPERHEFQKRHNSSLIWARKSPKSNHEKHEFQETAKMPTNKESIRFSRTSHPI